MNITHYLLVGTYTSGKSKGIYVYGFDQNTGNSELLNYAEVENPSYLTKSSNDKYVYCVTENDGKPSYANAFLFDKERGELTFINRKETHGGGPCYIEMDENNSRVLTANYAGGSITVFSIDANGGLTDSKQHIQFQGNSVHKRQDKPHLHCVKFSPDNKYLYATDLGTDNIYRFDLDYSADDFLKTNSLYSFQVKPGSGPRHLFFHPDKNFLYLINELSGTVNSLKYHNGDIQLLQEIEIDNVDENEAGDISITPDGEFLYASSRTENDGIAIFSIDRNTGYLTKIDYVNTGIHPRNIAVTPNGKLLSVANKDDNSIEIYKIDKYTGLINNLNKDVEIDQPVCMLFIENRKTF